MLLSIKENAVADREYRVAILGNCCTHGEFVFDALSAEKGARVVGGFERDPERRERLAKAIRRDLCPDPMDIVRNKDIDIVAVCTSPNEKLHWIEELARAGKHVFLNKPMCESLESAYRIEETANTSKVKIVYDIPVIKFQPLLARVLQEVREKVYGRPISYYHSWGFTFSHDFPLQKVWRERLDPPAISGGGEMTNLGVYAIDYMLCLFGLPISIQAKKTSYWTIYKDASVENFGQIIADYGDFFATVATGKQPLNNVPSMTVEDALDPINWKNTIEMQFENNNITILPNQNLFLRNGKIVSVDQYVHGFRFLTPFQQLVRAIEEGAGIESSVTLGRQGVEILTAAYQSSLSNGAVVKLPVQNRRNPLI